jgi:hypothetical protein
MNFDSAVNLAGAAFNVYSLRKSLGQERALHEQECAVATEQHFQQLSTELLAISKEADRDVWEQRNNQFNNLLVCATLMFGVATGNINEGTFQFDPHEEKLGMTAGSILSRDGMFVLLSGVSIGSLFLSIIACLAVMRRMSNYMIERSSALVDRLAISTHLAHRIAGTAQTQHRENLEGLLGTDKRKFYNRMGDTIGSGPKEARTSVSTTRKLGASKSAISPRSMATWWGSPDATGEEPSPSVPFLDETASVRARRPPPPSRTLTEAALGDPSQRHLLNFSIFYREYCGWLSAVCSWTFVIGTLTAWVSVWFLLWDQFPQLYVPVVGFALVGLATLIASGVLDLRTRRHDDTIAALLRYDTNAEPLRKPYSPPSSPRREPQWPSPPASPPPAVSIATSPPLVHGSHAAQRLRELQSLLGEGLLSADEGAAKRAEILSTI